VVTRIDLAQVLVRRGETEEAEELVEAALDATRDLPPRRGDVHLNALAGGELLPGSRPIRTRRRATREPRIGDGEPVAGTARSSP